MADHQDNARFVANVLVFLAVLILLGGTALGLGFASQIGDEADRGVAVISFLVWSLAAAGLAAVLWALALILRMLSAGPGWQDDLQDDYADDGAEGADG